MLTQRNRQRRLRLKQSLSTWIVLCLATSLISTSVMGSIAPVWSQSTPVKAEDPLAEAKEKPPLKHEVYHQTTPLALVKSPSQYLNQGVQFSGIFNSFASLGLNYKKAFRDSKNYISMLILRPDAKQHKIPLSELKLVYPREQSEAVLDLESGDRILIKGSVFSDALMDPWIDVEDVTVIEKANQDDEETKTP